jgi:hypothetical protein
MIMKWLKRKLRNWLIDQPEEIGTLASSLKIRESDEIGAEPVLNFKVFSAVGGKIVEFRKYDRQRDRSENQTYIITNDQDFGERIAKIATMESLKT